MAAFLILIPLFKKINMPLFDFSLPNRGGRAATRCANKISLRLLPSQVDKRDFDCKPGTYKDGKVGIASGLG